MECILIKNLIKMPEKHVKDKDKRLEEADKTAAEVIRSLQVVEMKKAHKKIEDVEKDRKRSAIQSVRKRLSCHVDDVLLIAEIADKELKKPANQHIPFNKAKDITMTYESVCYDFKKTLEMKDEDFAKLFPKIEVETADGDAFVQSLISMARQGIHMQYYCDRFLH